MKNPKRNFSDSMLTGNVASNLALQRPVSPKDGADLRFFSYKARILTLYLPIVVLTSILGICFLDKPIADFCHSLNPNLLAVFGFLTGFGLSTWYILGSFLLFFTFRYLYRRKLYSNQSLFVFLSMTASGILADILKFILGRYRPEMLFARNLYGFDFFSFAYNATSLPSGHATSVAAFALSLYLLYPRYKLIYVIFALPVIASRVIIGSHFLTDVVVGSYLGILVTTYLWAHFKTRGIKLARVADSF